MQNDICKRCGADPTNPDTPCTIENGLCAYCTDHPVFHTVKYVNLSEVLVAIGYPDLAQDDNFMTHMDWATWGTSAFSLLGNNAVLDSIIELLESYKDQTFSVDQLKSLENKFWGFVGEDVYINLEA